jgi:hypothetical protein
MTPAVRRILRGADERAHRHHLLAAAADQFERLAHQARTQALPAERGGHFGMIEEQHGARAAVIDEGRAARQREFEAMCGSVVNQRLGHFALL